MKDRMDWGEDEMGRLEKIVFRFVRGEKKMESLKAFQKAPQSLGASGCNGLRCTNCIRVSQRKIHNL
jgi:hypothetical protein